MTSFEKAELLKSTISRLYSKEGRTISYISRLLEINRKTLGTKIKEWELPLAEPRRYLKPSNQKFLNRTRNLIKSRIDKDVPLQSIAKELNVSRDFLYRTIIPNDDVLKKAYADFNNRRKINAQARVETLTEKSRLNYDWEDLDGEVWKEILGYDGYFVSNMGRFKHYMKRYKKFALLKPAINSLTGRVYISLTRSDGKPKTLIAARVVGHAFVEGFSRENNTINHEDGNVQNNAASNLSWVSQSENNRHAYRELNRKKVNFKRYEFDKIIYREKYEFKTVASFAKFLGMSETQTRRYLDNPEKHQIKLINNCND